MRYQVEFVNDHALPEDVDWAFAELTYGATVLFMKRSRVTEDALTAAWVAWARRHDRLAA